nr:MAG TPA: hypothetical protein [Caudoviricetes sp.]
MDVRQQRQKWRLIVRLIRQPLPSLSVPLQRKKVRRIVQRIAKAVYFNKLS